MILPASCSARLTLPAASSPLTILADGDDTIVFLQLFLRPLIGNSRTLLFLAEHPKVLLRSRLGYLMQLLFRSSRAFGFLRGLMMTICVAFAHVGIGQILPVR